MNSQRSKKNTREAEFQAFHNFLGGGGGKVIGKLYIDLKHSIWRIQICQKKHIVSPTLYGFRGDAPHIITIHFLDTVPV